VRSEITIDRDALRANLRRLRDDLGETDLWAVVKANAYGHGAATVSETALAEGAGALCVATVGEGIELREVFPDARIVVLGPTTEDEQRAARDARLELVVSDPPWPDGIPLHVKVDTGMGRWGISDLVDEAPGVVGLLSHLASADEDPAFTERQIARFREIADRHPGLTAHLANSAGTLRFPDAWFDAVRVGLALHGLSPYGTDPADDGLRPALSWRSRVAQGKLLGPQETTGYHRRFVAIEPTWIGIVPVGYADGFRRELTGAEVLVGGVRREVAGTVSMDAFAVALDEPVEPGTPVTLIGDGLLAEELASRAGTITHDFVTRINSSPARATRIVTP
jgi:alanine racemase